MGDKLPDDNRAADALDGEYYEIEPRVWDGSTNLLCDTSKPMYQNKVAGEPNTGGDNKKPINAVLCYGKPIVAAGGKLIVAWNTGEGAKLYGKFGSGCDTVIWSDIQSCKDVCEDNVCDQEARAIQLKPCGQQPGQPTPSPTEGPTTTAQLCESIENKTTCKDNPVCYWNDGKCGIPPECSTWNDSNTKTCEAFKDQDGNKKCKYDKNSKSVSPSRPLRPLRQPQYPINAANIPRKSARSSPIANMSPTHARSNKRRRLRQRMRQRRLLKRIARILKTRRSVRTAAYGIKSRKNALTDARLTQRIRSESK